MTPGRHSADVKSAAAALPPHRRLDIQGLRALAVTAVVLYHAGLPVSGGFVGVDIFFVISGFVITGMLEREISAHGRLDLRRFYLRRLRRLGPALATVSLVIVASGFVLLNPLGSQQLAGSTALAASLFVANIRLAYAPSGYFAAPSENNPFLHTWSLSVEEQFYLVFPVVLWFLLRRWGRKGSVVALVILAVPSLAFCVWATYHNGALLGSTGPNLAFYASPARAWEFVAGAVVALSYDRILHLPRPVHEVLSWLGVLVLAYSLCRLSTLQVFPGYYALFPVLGTALLIGGGGGTTIPRRLLSLAPVVWLGDLSYSWYLWHWPALALARAHLPDSSHRLLGLVALLTLIPAYLSYRFIERPLRSRTTRDRRSVLRVIAATVAVPVLLASLLWSAGTVATPAVRQMRTQLGEHLDESLGCTHNFPNDAVTKTACTFSGTGNGRIVLIGDSNAGQFAEPVKAIAAEQHDTLTLATFPACPFVNIFITSAAYFANDCNNFVHQWTQTLTTEKPSLVIISAAATDYLLPASLTTMADPDTGVIATETAAQAQLWQRGLEWVLSRLHQAGVPVLLIQTTPHFYGWDPSRCLALTLYRDSAKCGSSQVLTTTRITQQVAATAQDKAAVTTGTNVLDLDDELCPQDLCVTNQGNTWFYRDGSHLSVNGAMSVLQPLRSAIHSAISE